MPPFGRPKLATFELLRLPESSPSRALFKRIALAVGLILLVSLGLWLDRDGLRDNIHPERPIRFVDVFYFTVVSLTTVGYGDIVPVTGFSRFVNAVILTPIRLIVWAIFLGTAYELVLLRTRESFQMKQLKERLKNHTIICGFGVKGRAILGEILAHDHDKSQIVVIEPSEEGTANATSAGVVALCGDASTESVLRAANIENAGHVLIAPHSDDQCVLICLTVRALNPKVRLVASAREEENIKLLYRAGADVVVAPSVNGGRLMGAAVHQTAVTRFLQDLLSFGNGLEVSERKVAPQEAGKTISQLPDLENTLILGLLRDSEQINYARCSALPLLANDTIVFLEQHEGEPTSSE